MAMLGDFASLLQLGTGVGIGLAVFRAPLEVRSKRLEREISLERAVLTGVGAEDAKSRLAELSSIQLSFEAKKKDLGELQLPFMIAIVFLAAINLCTLISAALWSSHVLSTTEIFLLLLVSVVGYIGVAAALEITARLYFAEVLARFRAWEQG